MHCLSTRHVVAVGFLSSYFPFFPNPVLSLAMLSNLLKLGPWKLSQSHPLLALEDLERQEGLLVPRMVMPTATKYSDLQQLGHQKLQ